MRLYIDLPHDLCTKLKHLATQEFRPLDLQAKYLLFRAITQAPLTPKTADESPESLPEVAHASAE